MISPVGCEDVIENSKASVIKITGTSGARAVLLVIVGI